MPKSDDQLKAEAAAQAEKEAAEKAAAECAAAEKAAAKTKSRKIRELSRATRDGKLVRVLTDDVRVWKDVGDAKDAK